MCVCVYVHVCMRISVLPSIRIWLAARPTHAWVPLRPTPPMIACPSCLPLTSTPMPYLECLRCSDLAVDSECPLSIGVQAGGDMGMGMWGREGGEEDMLERRDWGRKCV